MLKFERREKLRDKQFKQKNMVMYNRKKTSEAR